MQILTYSSITDDKVQEVKDKLKDVMTKIGMKVIVARNPVRAAGIHNAVPIQDVEWLSDFIADNGVTFARAIHILKRTHLPFHIPGYQGKKKPKLIV